MALRRAPNELRESSPLTPANYSHRQRAGNPSRGFWNGLENEIVIAVNKLVPRRRTTEVECAGISSGCEANITDRPFRRAAEQDLVKSVREIEDAANR